MQARPSKKPVYPSSPLPLICLKSITTAPLLNMRINLGSAWLFGTHQVSLLQLFLNKIPWAYNAEEIEAIAATRVLVFAREVGINNAVMEGDSWLVHHALSNDESLCLYLTS